MPQINVQVSDAAHIAAKTAAAQAQMPLREWVERACIAQAGVEAHDLRQAETRRQATK